MIKPYTYHFVFSICLKTGEVIELENTKQQLLLLTEEEARSNSVEKDYDDPTAGGSLFTHVGKNTIVYYVDGCCKAKIKRNEFDHIHMSRKAEEINYKPTLKMLVDECDAESVLRYMRERLIK